MEFLEEIFFEGDLIMSELEIVFIVESIVSIIDIGVGSFIVIDFDIE